MAEHTGVPPSPPGSVTAALDPVADELYGLPPDEFIGARDAAAALARERGDRELAKAIGRLRRPTRAAWLANLLARRRTDQLESLLGLAGGLAEAQRGLDGAALRALSRKRHQLVAAMAREAGRLALDSGDPPAESVLRDLQGILEAALARPDLADQVRSGRLTRTLSYSGFGPEATPGAVPTPAGGRTGTDTERAERERATRARDLAAAEDDEALARTQQDTAETERATTTAARDAARARVAALTADLEAAREQERLTGTAAREAETRARAAARTVALAATRTARARARLDELSS